MTRIERQQVSELKKDETGVSTVAHGAAGEPQPFDAGPTQAVTAAPTELHTKF